MTKGLDRILEGQGSQPAGSVLLTFGPQVGNPFNLATAPSIARVEGHNGDAQTWVVTLDAITSPQFDYANLDVTGSGLVQQVCCLTWGQDAIQFRAELDWKPGSFLVHGAFVDVTAQVTQPIPTPIELRFSASICPAEISQIAGFGPGGPTNTISGTFIAAGGTSFPLVVPVRARAFRIWQRFPTIIGGTLRPASLDVRQHPSLSLPTVLSHVRVGSTLGLDVAQWIPLHWAAKAITIINNDNIASSTPVIEFLIDVG